MTGVAVEYSREFDVPPESIDAAGAFDVSAALERDGQTSTAPRTVVGAWTTAQNDPNAPAGRSEFLVLEFDTADRNSSYTYDPDPGGTQRYDLDGAYAVTQTRDLDAESPPGAFPAPGYTVENSSTRVLVVEDFGSGTFTAGNGVSLDYRLYEPDTRGTRTYPLVLALHGIGESSTDNQAPLLNSQLGTAFAAPQRQQEDPSFVLVPQRKPSQGLWSAAEMTAALLELVEDTKTGSPSTETVST